MKTRVVVVVVVVVVTVTDSFVVAKPGFAAGMPKSDDPALNQLFWNWVANCQKMAALRLPVWEKQEDTKVILPPSLT